MLNSWTYILNYLLFWDSLGMFSFAQYFTVIVLKRRATVVQHCLVLSKICKKNDLIIRYLEQIMLLFRTGSSFDSCTNTLLTKNLALQENEKAYSPCLGRDNSISSLHPIGRLNWAWTKSAACFTLNLRASLTLWTPAYTATSFL